MSRTPEQKKRQAALARARYASNITESRRISREKTAVVRAARVAAINAIKLEKGCADCGFREHPSALHFDHRDPKTKRWTIAKRLTMSWSKLIAEIEKCDVRCANCHVVRSVQQGHLGRPVKQKSYME